MQEILSVTDLTNEIKKQLESRFSAVSVKGEITNFKEQTSGHFYFTLKDQGAQLSAVLFRGNAREISRLPKNGDQVVLHGEVNVYPPRGAYQLIVRKLEYVGVGELLMKLHERKVKLQALGWFDKERKRAIPKYPKTIGVVTSPTGAVIQDIVQILNRRNPGLHLLLNPVKVQGEGAAEEIARAIDAFNRFQLADLIIVCRGGGSLEDLWAFNEECVAQAIFQSKIPVISAVGHETDFSIADFVADLRAPTPSAAAEIASAETAQQLQYLASSKNRLRAAVSALVQHHRKQLASLRRQPLLNTPDALLGTHFQRIDGLSCDLEMAVKRSVQQKELLLAGLKKQAEALKPSAQIAAHQEKLSSLSRGLTSSLLMQWRSRKALFDTVSWRRQIDQAILSKLKLSKDKLSPLVAHLKGINPKNLLTKGYCILFQEKTDSVILSTQELKVQDKVRLQLHDGRLNLIVNGKSDE